MQSQDNPHHHPDPGSETRPPPPTTLEEAAFESFTQHLHNAFSNASDLLQTSKDLREENKRQALELQEKQAYIDRLEKELQEYRSQVFRSLNVFKISDQWISEQLNDIYQVLFNWVTQLPDIAEFPQIWPRAYAFLNDNGWVRSLEINIDAENIEHLQSELMTFGIFRVLWEHVFKLRWVGMDPPMQRRFEKIYEDMEKLDPKIGLQAFSKDIV